MTETTRQGPPEAFGLTWRNGHGADTRAGLRYVWNANDVTPAFRDAWGAHGAALYTGGFEYRGGSPEHVIFWETPGYDRAALARECEVATSLVPAYLAREAQIADWKKRTDDEAARVQAAEDEAVRTYRPRMIAAARESLDTQAWAWAKAADIKAAEAWIAMGADIGHFHASALEKLVARAAATVDRAMKAMRDPVFREAALAGDPAIREAALAACRLMSSWDEDRASTLNGRGWGKASCVRGHVLAGQESLDEALASHALHALRRHRKQLPAELQASLFESVAA